MFKKLLSAAACAALSLCVSVCASAEDAPVRIASLKGPTGIGMVGLMRDYPQQYAFTLCGAPDEIVAQVASGSADIAACPTNLAAVLYQKTSGSVQLLALNTLGVLHLVTSDPAIDSVDDLAGRTVYATGQASVPEYVIDYILAGNGLADSVTVEYVGEHSELAALLAAGKVETGILPEPHVTSALAQNSALTAALDLTDVFADTVAASGTDEDMVLSMGCVIVRKNFAEENPQAVSDFLDRYAASVAFVNGDPQAAGEQVAAFGIMPKAAVAARAIPNCHITFVEGDAMRAQIMPLYRLLHAANPASVGGTLPDDAFCYVR